ncbi:hypothetical protein O181_040589 [Austropuccinia psidii MF-1]|uniref:Uncharacterized protein n=1 Tax=Austropuccinia psidii MF-1 TaxID=1389203 RepID=A0A9Q3HFN9_9BASI|nr:hypothetical protein [Austropuccinia psidii MF-1]
MATSLHQFNSSKFQNPNVIIRPNHPHVICHTHTSHKHFFEDSIPLESLHQILLNILHRLLPWFSAQELTIQGGRYCHNHVESPPQWVFIANWTIFGVYGHILHPLAFLANSPPHQPQGGQPPTLKTRWVPNHKWTHLSHFWPKLAISNPWPLETTRGHHLKLRKPSPHSVERLSFTNVLCTKDSGMVHILYNISLCTKFAQQLNGDGFRTNIGGFPRLVDEVKEPSVDDAAIKCSGPANT